MGIYEQGMTITAIPLLRFAPARAVFLLIISALLTSDALAATDAKPDHGSVGDGAADNTAGAGSLNIGQGESNRSTGTATPNVEGSLGVSGNIGAANLAASATTDTTTAGNISSGTHSASLDGAGTINGILKANGSGVISQAVDGADYISMKTARGDYAASTFWDDFQRADASPATNNPYITQTYNFLGTPKQIPPNIVSHELVTSSSSSAAYYAEVTPGGTIYNVGAKGRFVLGPGTHDADFSEGVILVTGGPGFLPDKFLHFRWFYNCLVIEVAENWPASGLRAITSTEGDSPLFAGESLASGDPVTVNFVIDSDHNKLIATYAGVTRVYEDPAFSMTTWTNVIYEGIGGGNSNTQDDWHWQAIWANSARNVTGFEAMPWSRKLERINKGLGMFRDQDNDVSGDITLNDGYSISLSRSMLSHNPNGSGVKWMQDGVNPDSRNWALLSDQYNFGEFELLMAGGRGLFPTIPRWYHDGLNNRTTIGHNAATPPAGTATLNVEGSLGVTGDTALTNATVSGNLIVNGTTTFNGPIVGGGLSGGSGSSSDGTLANGSESSPSLHFSDASSGLYSTGAGNVSFGIGGHRQAFIDSNGLYVDNSVSTSGLDIIYSAPAGTSPTISTPQSFTAVLSATTTKDKRSTDLTLDGASTVTMSGTNTNVLIPPDNTTWSYKITVVARNSSDGSPAGASKQFERWGLLRKTHGSLVAVTSEGANPAIHESGSASFAANLNSVLGGYFRYTVNQSYADSGHPSVTWTARVEIIATSN